MENKPDKKNLSESNRNMKYLKSGLFSSFLFIFLFLFLINSASAISITQVQSKALSQSFGSAGIVFDSTGTRLIAFDTSNTAFENLDNEVSVYNLGTAYDLDTLVYSGVRINETEMAFNSLLKLDAGFISSDGQHMYIAIHNASQSPSGSSQVFKYEIRHYSLSIPFNITTLAFVDSYNLSLQGSGQAPEISSIFVNDNGSYIALGGAFNTSSGGSQKIMFESLATPFYLSSHSWINTYRLSLFGEVVRGFTILPQGNYLFSQIHDDSPLTNKLILSSNDSFPFSSAQGSFSCASHSCVETEVNSGLDRRGMYIISDFSGIFLFQEGAGTLYKYSVNDFSITNTTTTTNSSVANDLIDSFLSVFPNSETLSFKQKMAWVFLGIILLDLIIIIATHKAGEGVAPLVLYIISFLDIGLVIFFTAIGYIDFGIIVTLLLIGAVFTYFKFKGSGGNSNG